MLIKVDDWGVVSVGCGPLGQQPEPLGDAGQRLVVEPSGSFGDAEAVILGAPGVNEFIGAADVFHASDAAWATTSTPNATLTNGASLQELCIVPALKGLTLRGAKQALVGAGCRAGTVTTAYSSVVAAGRVVLQKTKPGVHLVHGAKVAFKLSLGPFHRH